MRRRYRRNGISPDLIKRILLYGVLLLLLAAAESSLFARIYLLPAAPDLILGAVIAVSLLDSRRAGAVVGVVGGFFSDAIGSVGLSLSPLFYLLVALTVGAMASKMLSGFPAYVLLMLPALLLRGAFTLFVAVLVWKHAPWLSVLRLEVLPELICTAIFCLPLYGIVKLSTLPLRFGRSRSIR